MAGSPLQRQPEWGAIATSILLHDITPVSSPFYLQMPDKYQDNATPQ
jgi:hypothetical protein